MSIGLTLDRFDPRKDKDALKDIFEDFIVNKSYYTASWKKFEEILNKRVLDLQYRNSMITAREDGKLVGFGTYTLYVDYLGIQRVVIHQILTKKDDSFKKNIEETIMRELINYVKSTLKIDKFYIICPDNDSALRSVLMKLNIKKSKLIWYENE